MRDTLRVAAAVALALTFAVSALHAGEQSWEDLDQAAKRAKIDEEADTTLKDVIGANPKTAELYKAA